MKIKTSVKTKIICTIGPSSGRASVITSMIRNGMDAARINFSHGTITQHIETIRAIRDAENKTGKRVTVIQDLQGPKIRLGDLSAPYVELRRNQIIEIAHANAGTLPGRLSTTYKYFSRDVKIGHRILFDDGKIEARTVGKNNGIVKLRIITGGKLTARKGINLPGTYISENALTDKDKYDLDFAFRFGVDYVSLSFVRSADDVSALRNFIGKYGPGKKLIKIIAKIEKPEAVHNIDAILRASDAIMVARGDLGVEMAPEKVPILQKMIVRKCNEEGKPVIIATQMLESMISNPNPTRAEANDVANAVFDGADAVMLSGETAVGKNAVAAVKIMDCIIRNAEQNLLKYRSYNPSFFPSTHAYDFICRSACDLADELDANAIVAVTKTGMTAIRLAKYRPKAQIIAVTDSADLLNQLQLIWGLRGLVKYGISSNTDKTLASVEKTLLDSGYIKRGDKIVLLAGIPLGCKCPSNMIKVATI